MKWEQNRCPTCGEPAKGTLESLTGRADLDYDAATDSFEYGGWTEIFWDGQMSVEENGKHCLMCPEGHEWWTKPVQEEPDGKDKETSGLVPGGAGRPGEAPQRSA